MAPNITIRERKIISLCSIIIAICIKKKRKVTKTRWCKKWLEDRKTMGSHVTIRLGEDSLKTFAQAHFF